MQKLNIYWFRNDLRLDHNRVLNYLKKSGEKAIGIFLLDKNLLNGKYSCNKRNLFLYESLNDLAKQLEKDQQSRLFIIDNSYLDFFTTLVNFSTNTGITLKVLTSRDYSSYAIKRDKKIRDLLQAFSTNSNKFKSIKNLVLYDILDPILNKQGEALKVFTPYKYRVLDKIKQDPTLLDFNYSPIKDSLFYDLNDNEFSLFTNFTNFLKSKIFKTEELRQLIYNLSPKKSDKSLNLFKGGSMEAQNIWGNFKRNKINNYKTARNFLDMDGTSKLSPHLKFGTISPYQLVKECMVDLEQNDGVEHFLSEVIWREFYKHILMHFPHIETDNFNPKYNKVRWLEDDERFLAWCEGKTGYPIVDACMRQLNTTGWMHNRGRMIVASFLTKDLHIHWKKGEKYFQKHLIDYDLSSNNGGWQWTAGTGTDASPYFRIFNPIEQGKRFDEEGKYIKQYVPELKNLPASCIHEPWRLSDTEQLLYNFRVGDNYPTPIVDHALERKKALELYSFIKPDFTKENIK